MSFRRVLLTLIAVLISITSAVNADEWQSLFDGQSLEGWDGNPQLWRVEDGAITGQTTADNTISKNQFLIWRGGDVDNFELELEYRIVAGNSGIQYRSREFPEAGRKTSRKKLPGHFSKKNPA